MSGEITYEQIRELENEANIFACCLLMPKQLFEKDMIGFNLGEDDAIKILCKKYQVPANAILFRAYLLNNHDI